jgi:hypothetical protein
MPWLPFYADERDFEQILNFLNEDLQITFIVSAGEKQWIAQKKVDSLKQMRYCLWHIPSGPLPLIQSDSNKEDSLIIEPWKGWEELCTGEDSSTPYFGAGHPGVFWLNVRLQGRMSSNSIGLSSFEWIGDHYKIVGDTTQSITKKWWQSLQRWVKSEAQKIPRSDSLSGTDSEIWAFPSAYSSFKSGIARDDNP